MTRFNIFQIDHDKDKNDVIFSSYDRTVRIQGKVNFSIYNKVWSGANDIRDLDEIFEMFNFNHPSGFRGHSLSVSDVIEIVFSDMIDSGYYFVDSFGFQKIV